MKFAFVVMSSNCLTRANFNYFFFNNRAIVHRLKVTEIKGPIARSLRNMKFKLALMQLNISRLQTILLSVSKESLHRQIIYCLLVSDKMASQLTNPNIKHWTINEQRGVNMSPLSQNRSWLYRRFANSRYVHFSRFRD